MEAWNITILSYVEKVGPYFVVMVSFVENVVIVDWIVARAVAVEGVAVGGLVLDQPARDLLEELLDGGDHDLLDVTEGGLVLVHHRVCIEVTAQDDKVSI